MLMDFAIFDFMQRLPGFSKTKTICSFDSKIHISEKQQILEDIKIDLLADFFSVDLST